MVAATTGHGVGNVGIACSLILAVVTALPDATVVRHGCCCAGALPLRVCEDGAAIPAFATIGPGVSNGAGNVVAVRALVLVTVSAFSALAIIGLAVAFTVPVPAHVPSHPCLSVAIK